MCNFFHNRSLINWNQSGLHGQHVTFPGGHIHHSTMIRRYGMGQIMHARQKLTNQMRGSPL
jgi:hypothetical protein